MCDRTMFPSPGPAAAGASATAASRTGLHGEDYMQALQPHHFRCEAYHRQLSKQKPMPPAKPSPPPAKLWEAWSIEEVADFVRTTLTQAYGSRFGGTEEVVANLHTQLVDGARLKHLRVQDWEAICPCIGPRTHIIAGLEGCGPPAAPVPTPPAPPAQRPLSEPPLSPVEQSTEAALVHILGVTNSHNSGPSGSSSGSPNPNLNCGGDSVVRVLQDPEPHRPMKPSKTLLLKRSKFSNHRLIDMPWNPDSSRSWVVQLWQMFVFELLRLTFIALIIRKFGFRPHQVVYLLTPLIATWICCRFNLLVNYDPALFISIVVFPLSFSMNAAYQRRETALQTIASVKTSAIAVHLFGEAWSKSQLELPLSFRVDSARIIREHFVSISNYLTAVDEEDKQTMLGNIAQQYEDLFYLADMFRLTGIPPPLVAVPFNNVINMMTGFESLRVFADYRTPCCIRAFCKSTLVAMAIALAPLFANVSQSHAPIYGYLLCFVWFWLLLSMDNIQAMLENPYLSFGRRDAEDDINLGALKGTLYSKKRRAPKAPKPSSTALAPQTSPTPEVMNPLAKY